MTWKTNQKHVFLIFADFLLIQCGEYQHAWKLGSHDTISMCMELKKWAANTHRSPMTLSVAQVAGLCLAFYVLWRIVRPFVVKSPLAHIRGPPSESWWKGIHLTFAAYADQIAHDRLSTGNFHQVFNRDGWKFHHDILKKYGSVVKLYNLFNVRLPVFLKIYRSVFDILFSARCSTSRIHSRFIMPL